MERRRRIFGDARPDPLLQVFLSLFILLVAFFVLLNANSTLDFNRSADVIESLRDAFPSSVEESATVELGEVGGGAAAERLRNTLQQSIELYLPEARVEIAKGGATMVVTVAVDAVLRADGGLRPEAARFVSSAGALLAAAPPRFRYTMAALLPADGTDEEPASPSVAGAAGLASAALAAGAPSGAVSAGLVVGDPSPDLRMLFSVEPASAGVGLAPAGG